MSRSSGEANGEDKILETEGTIVETSVYEASTEGAGTGAGKAVTVFDTRGAEAVTGAIEVTAI